MSVSLCVTTITRYLDTLLASPETDTVLYWMDTWMDGWVEG